MKELLEDKDRRLALIIALIINALILFFLSTIEFEKPEIVEEEEVEEILIELSWAGSASQAASSSSESVEESSQSAPAQEVATQEEASQEIPVSTAENSPPDSSPSPEPSADPEPETSEELDAAAAGVWGSSTSSNDGPDSEEEGPGVGTGHGALGGLGGGWSLEGRDFVGGDVSTGAPDDEGKVVLKIWVDRKGNVTRTEVDLRHSVNPTPYLRSLAEKAAKRAKFNVDNGARVEQQGSMTFIFKLE